MKNSFYISVIPSADDLKLAKKEVRNKIIAKIVKTVDDITIDW
ncbi:MAG: hypothetical protein WCY05_00940 [Candidatus Omnitrophota bacterium]